jgi:hypothetical protein
MLVPNFLLTKTVPITIYRKTQGSYVDGIYVPGTETQVTRNVNIQPLKPSEIMLMPESERTKEWYKLYCAEDLLTLQEGASGHDADEFVWQGYRYRIMKVKNYAMGILNHHCAYASRISVTPN